MTSSNESDNVCKDPRLRKDVRTLTGKKISIMTIKENYAYFKRHLVELMQDYYDKYIVIKDCELVGCYDTFTDAYYETIKKEKLGTFIIQHCVSLEDSTEHFANSNVLFGGIQR